MTRWEGDRADAGWRSTLPKNAPSYTVRDYTNAPDGDTERTRIVCATYDKAMADDCREWEEKRKLREAKT